MNEEEIFNCMHFDVHLQFVLFDSRSFHIAPIFYKAILKSPRRASTSGSAELQKAYRRLGHVGKDTLVRGCKFHPRQQEVWNVTTYDSHLLQGREGSKFSFFLVFFFLSLIWSHLGLRLSRISGLGLLTTS